MKNALPKILITGCEGQVGHALTHHPLAQMFKVIAMNRNGLDITCDKTIHHVLQEHKPDFVINAAAYTAVDKAESETENATRINHEGVAMLAELCNDKQIPLVHLSTDYVFDGASMVPYQEKDQVNPLNVYGESKLKGEQAIRNHCKRYIILRVSAVFSARQSNFVKTMLRLGLTQKEGDTLRVVKDQFTCPTSAEDIASTIYHMLLNDRHIWGTFHYCSLHPMSWFDFTKMIIDSAREFHHFPNVRLEPISTDQYPTAAKRPPYSVLDCHKITREYGIKQPLLENSLPTAVQEILKKMVSHA